MNIVDGSQGKVSKKEIKKEHVNDDIVMSMQIKVKYRIIILPITFSECYLCR